MSKMNPEIKAKWVAALRSGEYQQTDEALHKEGAYCCLGVLCELSGMHKWEPKRIAPEVIVQTYSGRDGLPPNDVAMWAGFEPKPWGYQTPKVLIDGAFLSIDSHNDNGRTFAELADAIEEQL